MPSEPILRALVAALVPTAATPIATTSAAAADAAPAETTIYAGVPDVSWNRALRRRPMVFEGDDAFRAATSTDLVHRSPPTAFLKNPAGAASRAAGQPWMSCATLFSPDTPSDRVTGATGRLCFVGGVWGITDHTMWRGPVTLGGATR